jgi:hypothetical protein
MEIKYEAIDKYHADLKDPGRGKHMWTMLAMFIIGDPGKKDVVHMDMENLLTIEGPGCFKCEQIYSPDLARRFCQGILSDA